MSVVVSPAVGRIVEVLVAVGDVLTAGQEVVVVESMKVEIPVVSETAGRVVTVDVAVGGQVQAGDRLVAIE